MGENRDGSAAVHSMNANGREHYRAPNMVTGKGQDASDEYHSSVLPDYGDPSIYSCFNQLARKLHHEHALLVLVEYMNNFH